MLWHCHSNLCLSRALYYSLPTLSFPIMDFRVNKEIYFMPKLASPATFHRESFKLFVSDRISQREDDHELVGGGSSPVAGGIVALGKFDALHIGHRELAIQASKVGVPFLLSFVGMAEVLAWEPRLPIVANCDRKRILSSWAPFCRNMVPEEYEIEFSSVRHLSPQQFVEKLSNELRVRGVVAGENYRFGYKAAGDAQDLIKLCQEYGMEVCIVDCVMDRNQFPRNFNSSNSKERGQVSSTRVRHALAAGDMKYVSELLGREHRLVLMADDHKRFTTSKNKLSGPRSCLLNLGPKEGLYEDCSLIVGDQISVPCRVVLDKTQIHIEIEGAVCNILDGQDFQYLSVEFCDSRA